MQKVFSLLIAALLISQPTFGMDTTEKPSEAMEQTILRLLADPALEAIQNYYGESRQYWRDNLISVRKVPDTPYYETVMQVETFVGPHNPPYGIETMTFYISYGEAELKKFEHKDELT